MLSDEAWEEIRAKDRLIWKLRSRAAALDALENTGYVEWQSKNGNTACWIKADNWSLIEAIQQDLMSEEE